MTCDWTKENVVLFIYGELADDAKFEYEQHVRHCLGCRRELDTALAFKAALAAARMGLSTLGVTLPDGSTRSNWPRR